MVILWSGRGYLVPVGTFVISLVMEWVTESLTGDEAYYQESAWPLSLALLAAAALAYGVGKRLNRPRSDPHAQPSVAAPAERARHTFFFIRMEYWGPILAALAAGSCVARSLR
jgi:hypothetical protein